MYWGGAATPQKSAPAVVTKMQPPPIIEDAAGQQQQHDPATIVPMGQAEPGRDVFAGDRAGDIKASEIPPTVRNENDDVVVAGAVDKEISSVVTGPLTTATDDSARTPAGEQEKEEEAGSGDHEPAAKDVKPEGVQPQNENVGMAPTAEQGPLEQHDMEADRVAADLYPSS
jgi:hypothetical protein